MSTFDLAKIHDAAAHLKESIEAIQMPRSGYQLEHFVVGEKDTPIAAWRQCVLELQVKYFAIQRGVLAIKKIDLEIQQLLSSGEEIDQLTALEKDIDRQETQMALKGAGREFECLYGLYLGFGRTYTHEEIQADEDVYWAKRLMRQAEQDIAACGGIGVGNLDALRTAEITPRKDNHGNLVFEIPTALAGRLRPPALPAGGDGGSGS